MTVALAAILIGGHARSLAAAPAAQPPVPVVALVRRLAAAGIAVTMVEDLQEARAVLELREASPRAVAAMDDSGAAPPPLVPVAITPLLLDLEDCASDDPEDLELAQQRIAECRAAFPAHAPIVITSQAPPRLLLECFRAGAADVIDLGHEGTARARATVLRAAAREEQRRAERQLAAEVRALLDELVRDLVRTERRTIDLEQRLGGGGDDHDDLVYLERIKARHEQLLARYLSIKSG